MAQKLKHQAPAGAQAPATMTVSNCKAEGCKKKAEKMDFCSEHYDWFKFGLITKEGKKPIDFDKKYAAFSKHRKVA